MYLYVFGIRSELARNWKDDGMVAMLQTATT